MLMKLKAMNQSYMENKVKLLRQTTWEYLQENKIQMPKETQISLIEYVSGLGQVPFYFREVRIVKFRDCTGDNLFSPYKTQLSL